MSYTITDKATKVSVSAETRTEAARLLANRGVNHYIAVHLLDAADGLIRLDMIDRDVTVTKGAPRRVVDFYLDGSPVYGDA